MKNIPVTALEGVQSKSQSETEVALYCKIGEPEGLKECIRHEQHHQLEGKFENGVKCRVRKVHTGGENDVAHYYFTYKLFGEDENVNACQEHTVEVDESFFEGFKKIANRALVKTRYVFASQAVTMTLQGPTEQHTVTIPNVEYEVDVYTREDGQVSSWCKIDVEIDPIVEYLSKEHPQLDQMKLRIKVSHLPFKPVDVMLPDKDNSEQQQVLDEIWKEFTQTVK